MPDDRTPVKRYVCPGCFAREIDYPLNHDPDDGEYYCRRCCWAGTEERVLKAYADFTDMKYPDRATPYP